MCPSCGAFVEELNEETGWCYVCSPPTLKCTRCGREVDASGRCQYCKQERWLERNADALESFTAQGYSLAYASQRVRYDVRPNCIVCGVPIYRGPGNKALFCGRLRRCRKAKRRLRTLTDQLRKELPLEQARAAALEKLKGELEHEHNDSIRNPRGYQDIRAD